VHTLKSIYEGLLGLGLAGSTVILSDSSETSATVDAARSWASDKEVQLEVDRSEHRRVAKEARNVLMSRASSDLLIQVDADVIVPTTSLSHLLRCLTDPPTPFVAVGVASADPGFRGFDYKAAAWQLNVTRRYASSLPDDVIRAEAACWGAWRSFYGHYRFPVGADSLADDVTLARHLSAQELSVRNCANAVVYKTPAATLRDFMLQTHRTYAASGHSRRRPGEFRAAAIEAAKDPLGAALYAYARIWSAREQRRRPATWSEEWEASESTKR
jgi:hypothetical protein